jgi:hypothetical protein
MWQYESAQKAIIQFAIIFSTIMISTCTKGSEIFSDAIFNISGWQLVTEQEGNGGNLSFHQESIGGNTDEYMHITLTVNAAPPYSVVFGAFFRTGAVYDPQTQGEIVTLEYSEDSIMFDGFGDGQHSGLALRQNDVIYYANFPFPGVGLIQSNQSSWTSQSFTSLRAEDFGRPNTLGGPHTPDVHPDFSSGGAPIEFGFYRADTTPSFKYSIIAGIDNWSVTIHNKSLEAGSLQVVIEPQEAIVAGAQWRRVGTSVWYDSGHIEMGVPIGEHIIEFKDVPGYVTPGNQTATLEPQGQLLLTGTYIYVGNAILSIETIPLAGEIFINNISMGLSPWVGTINAASHTIGFGPVDGYFTPVDQIVTLLDGQTYYVIGNYMENSQYGSMRIELVAIERYTGIGYERFSPTTIVSVQDNVRLLLRCLSADGIPLANQKAVIGVEDPILSQTFTGTSPLISQTDNDGYMLYPADVHFGDTGLTVELPVVHVFRFFMADGGAYDVALGADNHGFPSVMEQIDYDSLTLQFDDLIISSEPGTIGILPMLPPSMPTHTVPTSDECFAAQILSLQYPNSGTRNLWRETQMDVYSNLCPKALPLLIAEHFVDRRVEKNIVIYAPSATVCAAGILVPGAQPVAVVGCPILVAQAKKDAIFSIAEGVTDVWNPQINYPYAIDGKQVVHSAELVYNLVHLVKSGRHLYQDISYLHSRGPLNHASQMSNNLGVQSSTALRDSTTILAAGALKHLQHIYERDPLGEIMPESYIEVYGPVDIAEGKPLNVSHIRFNWSTNVWQDDYGEAGANVPIGLVFVIPPSAIQWLRQTECSANSTAGCIRMEWAVGNPVSVESFKCILDRSPHTDLAESFSDELSNDTTAIEFDVPELGVWYFHLASKDADTRTWLPTRHYKITLQDEPRIIF